MAIAKDWAMILDEKQTALAIKTLSEQDSTLAALP
jgi:hypothetical protein